MIESVIALGSNIGDRVNNLTESIEFLGNVPKTKINKISSFYETKPFEVPDRQRNYVNGCVSVYTNLSAHALLGVCLGIESAMGRKRKYIACPRIIDLDILFYGDLRYESKELIVPHPRIKERAFVIVPLRDIFKNGNFYSYSFLDELNNIDTLNIVKL